MIFETNLKNHNEIAKQIITEKNLTHEKYTDFMSKGTYSEKKIILDNFKKQTMAKYDATSRDFSIIWGEILKELGITTEDKN